MEIINNGESGLVVRQKLNDNFSEADSRITTAQTTADGLATDVADAQAAAASAASDASSALDVANQAAADVQSVQNGVNANASDITDLETAQNALSVLVNEHEESINDLESEYAVLYDGKPDYTKIVFTGGGSANAIVQLLAYHKVISLALKTNGSQPTILNMQIDGIDLVPPMSYDANAFIDVTPFFSSVNLSDANRNININFEDAAGFEMFFVMMPVFSNSGHVETVDAV